MGDEAIRKCSSCGHVLEPGDDICTKCGALFEESGEDSEGEGSIGAELLSLANDFLCVSKISPQWFELTSRPGAQIPGQKATIKYEAVAQLVPEKYQVLFWEKMMETLLGIDADSSQAGPINISIDENQKIHGHLMFGGPYGLRYDRLHRVVRSIANEQGWQFELSISRPVMDFTPTMEALPSHSSRKGRWIPAILAVAVILVFAAALVGILSKEAKETPVAEKPKTVAAVQEAQKAGAAQKPAVSTISAAIDYNAQGMKKAKAGNMEEAAGLFEKAVQASPDNSNAWNNLGLALRKIGKKEEAVRAYQRAIAINPGFALVHKNLGIVFEQMGRKKEAAEAYLKYAQLNGSAADARTAREKAAKLLRAAKKKETRP